MYEESYMIYISRDVATTIGEDIQAMAGPLQVCAGHLAGYKAAVHAMHQVFESPETEAVILVDASNAFNTLNWKVALQNINSLCPSLAKILINMYWDDVQLFINGETLLSQKGTIQGDPLAMAMYAIAISPLIHHLEDEHAKQIWFADDAAAGGDLAHLKIWLEHIVYLGHQLNASKLWLIVKEDKVEEAHTIFQGTGVAIIAEGKRHLGRQRHIGFVDIYLCPTEGSRMGS